MTLKGYKYCEGHLKLLAPDEVRAHIIEIIRDETGSEEHEVFEEARIEDDLSGTSLDQVEIVMRVEEEFGIEIPDEDAQMLQSVRDFIGYMADVRLREINKTSGVDAGPAAGAGVRKAQRTQRILEQTVEGEQFRKYYEALGLDADEIVRLFRKIIGSNRIYHVTMIVDDEDEDSADGSEPEDGEGGGELVEESKPERLHIFLLGKDKIYYFKLVGGLVWFEWAALADLILTYELSFRGKGVSEIIVRSRPRNGGAAHGKLGENLRDAMFKFKGAQIEGALDFLSKYLVNMEAEDE